MSSDPNLELLTIFGTIGLDDKKCEETLKNPTLTSSLKEIIIQAEKHKEPKSPFQKNVGNLLYHIATKLKKQVSHHRDFLIEYVVKKKNKFGVEI